MPRRTLKRKGTPTSDVSVEKRLCINVDDESLIPVATAEVDGVMNAAKCTCHAMWLREAAYGHRQRITSETEIIRSVLESVRLLIVAAHERNGVVNAEDEDHDDHGNLPTTSSSEDEAKDELAAKKAKLKKKLRKFWTGWVGIQLDGVDVLARMGKNQGIWIQLESGPLSVLLRMLRCKRAEVEPAGVTIRPHWNRPAQVALKDFLTDMDENRINYSPSRKQFLIDFLDKNAKRRVESRPFLRVPSRHYSGVDFTSESLAEAVENCVAAARRLWNDIDTSERDRYAVA